MTIKKLMSAVLGLSLLVPVASFAQDTGGCKRTTGKKATKTKTLEKKAHKGGKKGTKANPTTTSTTPPAK